MRTFVLERTGTFMSIEITKLENGLIVATDPMPHLESAALGVWVGLRRAP